MTKKPMTDEEIKRILDTTPWGEYYYEYWCNLEKKTEDPALKYRCHERMNYANHQEEYRVGAL